MDRHGISAFMCSSTFVCEAKFHIWLPLLCWFLQRAFMFGSNTSIHNLHVRAIFVCEQQLVAECVECSMKSINPSPAEVQYV